MTKNETSQDLTDLWRALPLGDATRHAEALTLAATRSLRAGRPADAFEFIDRRCRIDGRPRAADLAIRALAARLCGRPEDAAADLSRAASADPLDPFVGLTRLRLARGEAEAREAALAVATSPFAPADALRAALERLTAASEPFARLDILDGRLTGFAAWTPGTDALLTICGPDDQSEHRLAPDPSLPFTGPAFAAALIDLRLGFSPSRFRLVAAERVHEAPLWPRGSRMPVALRRRAPDTVPCPARLAVIVPAYRGAEATLACLAVALAEARTLGARVIVVDDASPEPDLVRSLQDMAERGEVELLRNAANLGFGRAVARGLAEAAGHDVLLLNADAFLPESGLRRLAEAAYAAPDIGTVTPLSNNGEYASFPRHGESAPMPEAEEARRIDRAAERVHAGRLIDLPNGTGFCLFIRHDCLQAIGGMPSIYGRGYFEDVELCLQARRAGFRNVCAPSIFVAHQGSLSFGAEKAALAVRNLALLRQRFPGFEAECAAYAEADPLREARADLAAALGIEPGAARITHAPMPEGVASLKRPPTLGLPLAAPSIAAGTMIRGLSRALRARLPEARIVVLGTTAEDLALMALGNVFVTGPIAEGDHAGTALRYGASALAAASPACLDLCENTARAANLPLLSLPSSDPDTDARNALLALVDRFADRLAPPSPRGDAAPAEAGAAPA